MFESLDDFKKELEWLKSFLGAPMGKKGNGVFECVCVCVCVFVCEWVLMQTIL